MTVSIQYCGEIRKFYPYRTGSLKSISLIIEDRDGQSVMHFYLNKYLKSQGCEINNHICWETTSGVCFMYSDHKLLVGNSIEEGFW